jgi:hypothetical protein
MKETTRARAAWMTRRKKSKTMFAEAGAATCCLPLPRAAAIDACAFVPLCAAAFELVKFFLHGRPGCFFFFGRWTDRLHQTRPATLRGDGGRPSWTFLTSTSSGTEGGIVKRLVGDKCSCCAAVAAAAAAAAATSRSAHQIPLIVASEKVRLGVDSKRQATARRHRHGNEGTYGRVLSMPAVHKKYQTSINVDWTCLLLLGSTRE